MKQDESSYQFEHPVITQRHNIMNNLSEIKCSFQETHDKWPSIFLNESSLIINLP